MKSLKEKTLDELLEDVTVLDIDDEVAELNNIPTLIGWFGVVNDKGIFAYFGDEKDAYRFRLDYINQILNAI